MVGLAIGARVRHIPTGRVGVMVSERDGRVLVLVVSYGYLAYPTEQREVTG